MESLTRSTVATLFASENHNPIIPDLKVVDWAVLDYFGWIHPSGHLGYVIAPLADDNNLRAILLRRTLTGSKKPRFEMCSWCHHVHPANGTAMFSVSVRGTDERRTIGTLICRNLDCSLRIRNLCSDPPSYMNEALHLSNKVYRLQNSIYRLMYRANCLYEA